MSVIFLIEDDEYVSRVYERAFRLSGHEIEIHPDAEDAIHALETAATLPAVIVIDLTLPKMSGDELLATITTQERFKATPIIVLTNSFSETIEKKVLDLGADLYLLKIDHEPKAVVEKVENLIEKYRAGYTR